MQDRTDYQDGRLPTRLRGRIRAAELQLSYINEMVKTSDAALRFGFAESIVELEEKLERLRSEARQLLSTDQPEAAAATGGAP